ncbi:DUF3221 domain-containing protein [Halobacillus aidingensis]|nr:DUF3221 domain-containing protein [Halobacillus aidingensis]
MRTLIMISVALLLTACGYGTVGSDDEPNTLLPGDSPDIYGYIMEKDRDEILVVNPEGKDFSHTKKEEDYHEAVRVRMNTDAEVGDVVEVWFDGGVAESYPGQAIGDKIKVVPENKPDSADLYPSEALKKAIEQHTLGQGVVVVESSTYEGEEDQWQITLKNTFSTEEEKERIVVKD